MVQLPGGGESLLLSFQSAVWLMASAVPPPPQGSQPHQGHPAAAGAPCGPAAPHLQLPEGPPDREGSVAGAGGGRRRLGRHRHKRWSLGAGGGAQWGVQGGGEKNTTEGQKNSNKINQKRNGHSISPECVDDGGGVQVASVIYCTVTHFHPLVLVSVTAGTAVSSVSLFTRVLLFNVCCCVSLLFRCTALHSYSL